MEKAWIGHICPLWVTCLIFSLFNQIGKFILVIVATHSAPWLIHNIKSNLASFYNNYWPIYLELLRNTIPKIKVIRLSTMTTKGICYLLSGVNKQRAVSLLQEAAGHHPWPTAEHRQTKNLFPRMFPVTSDTQYSFSLVLGKASEFLR